MKAGVFLERDGILNRIRNSRPGAASPATLEEFEINLSASEPLRKLKAAGFLLLVTTNQPGLSRGELSRRELDRMHTQLNAQFHLDEIFICPHDETDCCPCRKPKPGLFFEAAYHWQLDLDRSFVISDKWYDAQAAHVAGCTSVLLNSPFSGSGHHDFLVEDLPSAVEKIFKLQQQQHRRILPFKVAAQNLSPTKDRI